MSEARQSLTDAEKAEVLEKIADPVWRISHLYRIVDKFGTDIPFVPTAEQDSLIHAVYVEKQKRHAILKARQMGFSTLIAIILFDMAYFGENVTASIVDQDQDAASKKLEKIKFAYDGLGPLKERLTEDNSRAIGFANNSHIAAGKKARGSTNQALHISEWGPIAHDDPKRSEEIKTGALPSAENGLVFVETTFKGGKGGHLYDLLKNAMEVPAHLRTSKDFRFWFFPWYLDKSYTLEGPAEAIPPDVLLYFLGNDKTSPRQIGMAERLNVAFTIGQMLWYAKTKAEQGIFMFREYPTTVEEAMSAPVEGSIYGDRVMALRAKGRVIPFEYNHSVPVFASWDLGWDDSTSIWLWQQIGLEHYIIWNTTQRHKTAAEMKEILDLSGIHISGHFVPHDSASKAPGDGKNYRDHMIEAGFLNVVPIPRITNEWDGINLLRDLLPQCWFNLTHCKGGLEALEAYHVKDSSSGGVVAKTPVHDWSSHAAAALRYMAEAYATGLVKTAAARRVIVNPRMPDGSMADMTQAIFATARRRGGLAKSGEPNL